MKVLQEQVLTWLGVQEALPPLTLSKRLLRERAEARGLGNTDGVKALEAAAQVALLTRLDATLVPGLTASDNGKCRGIEVFGVLLQRQTLFDLRPLALARLLDALTPLNPAIVFFYEPYARRWGLWMSGGTVVNILSAPPQDLAETIKRESPCEVRALFAALASPFDEANLDARIRAANIAFNKAKGAKREELKKQLENLLKQKAVLAAQTGV